jgi:type III pantothenate kinase
MSLLLIDAGNARIKWVEQIDGQIGPAQFAAIDTSVRAALAKLQDSLSDAVDAVAVSSVAGPEFEIELRSVLAGTRMHEHDIWYAQSTRSAGDVINAYAKPQQLGVDRWAAMVGAHARMRSREVVRPLCVVDAGTALTIDALAHDGRHIGGLILPGIAMQRSALLDSTAEIAPKASRHPHTQEMTNIFATDTGSAVEHSPVIACAATVDRCAKASGSHDAPAHVILTGGDAPALGPWLATDYEICPNLVLEGLAILFEQRSLD